jgi:hypothetical protein
MNRTLIFLTFFFFLSIVKGYAAEIAVTPYGDYCKECATYGTSREVIPPKEAITALERYYTEKGYRIGVVYHRGRFIEVEIFKDDRRVDKVLFDRKTGRLRSIY